MATDEAKSKSQEKSDKVVEKTRSTLNETFSATMTRVTTSAVAAKLETEKEREIRLKDKDFQTKAESNIARKLLMENNLGERLFEKLTQAMEFGTATVKAAGFTIFLNVEDMIHAIQSISSNKEAAKNMSAKSSGLYSALVHMLKGKRAKDPEDNNREVLIRTLTAIRNFTDVQELRDQIEKEGKRKEIEHAIKDLQEKMKDDVEIQDLAKGVKDNLEGKSLVAENKAKALMKQIDEGTYEGGALYDVFLSHKRTE